MKEDESNMKLFHFKKDQEIRIGLVNKHGFLDLSKAGEKFGENLPRTLDELGGDPKSLDLVRKVADQVKDDTSSSLYLKEEEIQYLPVILNPEKIVCAGLNYLAHIREGNFECPEVPVLFSKFNNSLAGHNQKIPLPKASQKIDYEAELVIVMGKEAKDVEENDALSYVFGYTIGNDLSARDLQNKTSQWLLGKTLNGFAPVGPFIVTQDDIDASNLEIGCKVNGEVRQASNTGDMLFNCQSIISYISKHMTLKPGDLIFTGTPQGVMLGYPKDKQVWLKSGDQVEVTIEKIGTLKNILI